jgi:YVTN family beta-propeller protein
MKLRISGLLAIAAFLVACLLGAAQSLAQNAYITNAAVASYSVSVIDTATNTVTATIPVGNEPIGVAVTPDGSKVYVTHDIDNTVSVIDTATNIVTATIPVSGGTFGVAVSPDGSKVYVADGSATVSVIATATNTVIATIPVGFGPLGVAVTPDGSKVYVASGGGDINNTVSVIDTATNTVIATIPVGNFTHWRGGHSGWQQSLCHERNIQHRVSDRYRDEYGNRHNSSRPFLSLGHRGDTGRQ